MQPSLKSACDVAMAFLVKKERGMRVTFAEGFYHRPAYRYPENVYQDGNGVNQSCAVIEYPIAFHNLSIREMYLLDAGKELHVPGFLGRSYDKVSYLLIRKLRTRSIVNTLSYFLFHYKWQRKKGKYPVDKEMP